MSKKGGKNQGNPSNKRKQYGAWEETKVEDKICAWCRKEGVVLIKQEWIDGWDGRLVYTYRCIHCQRESYGSVTSPDSKILFMS